jgi:cytochrome c2
MEARGIEWPRFTTQELADLTSFLYFLPFADPQGDPARGAEAFATRSCADCHSGEAGSTHPGPDLTGAEVAGSPAALVSAMWNHAPVMKEAVLSEGRPWPELTGDELRDLYAFLRRGAGPP